MVIEITTSKGQTNLVAEGLAEYMINLTFDLARSFLEAVGNLTELLGCLTDLIVFCNTICVQLFNQALATHFSEFQIKLLHLFLVIVITHVVFIFIAWKHYGDKILKRFLPQAGASSNHFKDQLYSGASELKLPSEHTPRW